MKPGKLVEVRWLDTSTWSNWKTKEVAADSELITAVTVGYIILRTKKKLIVASTYVDEEDGKVSEVTAIPAGCIVSVKVLRQ